MNERTVPLFVLRTLLQTPNLSTRELTVALLGESRASTAARGKISNAVGHLFVLGAIVQTGDDASHGAIGRRYSVARGIGPMTIDLALAQDLTLWEALLLSSPLGAET